MTISIDIPDAQAARVRDAYAAAMGYDLNKQDGETKPAFVRRMLARHVKDVVKSYEADAARAAASAAADSQLSVT
jgi:hypothetical protein